MLALLVVPAAALARAGGGQHYSSPSHSYSSHSYSSSNYHSHSGSSSRSSYRGSSGPAPWLLNGNPVVAGIAALLVVLVLVGANYRARNEPIRVPRSAPWRRERQRSAVAAGTIQAWVKALEQDDPEFKLDDLYSKARRVFEQVQRGWFERDLTRARPFLSAAMFQRFTVQLELMRREGIRNAISNWHVLEMELVGLEHGRSYDTAQIRIHAQMHDTDVAADTPDAQAIAAAKSVAPEQFVEVWSFVRRRGAKSRRGADLFEGRCPNCGAPFNGGASNACEFCKAVVNSGHYDWTLAEITQGSESMGSEGAVSGLAEALQSDPTFNTEVLEDRTSLVFWRWIEAQAKAETRPLAKLAVETYVDQLGAEISALGAHHQRKVVLECAVGAVITRMLRQQDGFDQAHLEIRWSARMGNCAVGEAPRALPTLAQRWVFVLVRKTGARPHADTGLATDRCGNCGAPLTDDGNLACEFCGVIAASAEHDWVLAAAMPYVAWNASAAHAFHLVVQRPPAAAS